MKPDLNFRICFYIKEKLYYKLLFLFFNSINQWLFLLGLFLLLTMLYLSNFYCENGITLKMIIVINY